jgi:hypothetical protein
MTPPPNPPPAARASPALATVAAMALVFAVNAAVCWRLWFADFYNQMGSVEGSFIAIARYLMLHPADHRWFPMWFCGIPFTRVYQPGFHVTVAALATALHWTPQRAYHLMAALAYSAGPPALFWLCYRLTRSRGYALVTALAYSLASPSLLLVSDLRRDIGGFTLPRRFFLLVGYGDAPHLAGLVLLPLVVWTLHEAVANGRRRFYASSAVLMAMLMVVNWTATVGLAFAVIAYFFAQAGAVRPWRWLAAAGIPVTAYLLICRWIPPDVLLSIPGNAANSDGTRYDAAHWTQLAALAALVAVANLFMERARAHLAFRFFASFFLCSGFVVLGRYWAGWSLTPQAHRFQPEMEMALLGALAFPLWRAWGRWPRGLRAGLLAAGILLGGCQLVNYCRFAALLTAPVQVEDTIEYRMAKAFERTVPGGRVFAPGSVAIWMNLFTGTPQMVGCCDQSVPHLEQRIAFYTIYSGANAGSRDERYSELWLKAYGASAIGVSGPGSRETYKPFANPAKFEGHLPVVWREGDNAIYAVPGRSGSLAHVIRPAEEVRRAPAHGLDISPLLAYVAALDDASLPEARLRWIDEHRFQVDAALEPGQRVSVQMTYAPGWRAASGGRPVPLHADALGLMVAAPDSSGPTRLEFTYDDAAELRFAGLGQLVGVLLLLACVMAGGQRPKR